jgi:hypothetical protein
MNAGYKAINIWRVLTALAILYCLLLPKTELQLGAWQTDLSQETIIQKARHYRDLGITTPAARPILTVWEAPSSYEQLLAQAELTVLGKFLDQKSRLSGDRMHIETVCIFRADQVISGQIDSAKVPAQARVLQEVAVGPLKDNEVFVIRLGGKLELFGVQMEEIETAFPAFKKNRMYILFLHTPPSFSKYPKYYGQPSVKAYETIAGPHSIILVDKAREGESRIESLVNNPQLRTELQVKFQSKLSLFLQHIKKE